MKFNDLGGFLQSFNDASWAFSDSVPPLDWKKETSSLLCLFNHETRWCRWGGAKALAENKASSQYNKNYV